MTRERRPESWAAPRAAHVFVTAERPQVGEVAWPGSDALSHGGDRHAPRGAGDRTSGGAGVGMAGPTVLSVGRRGARAAAFLSAGSAPAARHDIRGDRHGDGGRLGARPWRSPLPRAGRSAAVERLIGGRWRRRSRRARPSESDADAALACLSGAYCDRAGQSGGSGWREGEREGGALAAPVGASGRKKFLDRQDPFEDAPRPPPRRERPRWPAPTRSRCATLAQLVEQLIRNQQVSGSSPESGSKLRRVLTPPAREGSPLKGEQGPRFHPGRTR